MVSPSETEQAMKRHADCVWHVCFLYFGRTADAQDAFQESFLRFHARREPFRDSEHEKAWLIRVATNICKDMLKKSERRNVAVDEADTGALASRDSLAQPGGAVSDVLDALSSLPPDHRTALYLTAVQGYTAREVARLMGATENTVYSWVSRARERMKELLK